MVPLSTRNLIFPQASRWTARETFTSPITGIAASAKSPRERLHPSPAAQRCTNQPRSLWIALAQIYTLPMVHTVFGKLPMESAPKSWAERCQVSMEMVCPQPARSFRLLKVSWLMVLEHSLLAMMDIIGYEEYP